MVIRQMLVCGHSVDVGLWPFSKCGTVAIQQMPACDQLGFNDKDKSILQ